MMDKTGDFEYLVKIASDLSATGAKVIPADQVFVEDRVASSAGQVVWATGKSLRALPTRLRPSSSERYWANTST